MKLRLLILFLLGLQLFQTKIQAQNLSRLEFKRVEDAPTLIEREKAVIYIRSVIPDIFVESTNPYYTFRKVTGKQGEWILRVNPSESYMISIGAKNYLSTIPIRMVLKLREVQIWEVTGKGREGDKIPVNFLISENDAELKIDDEVSNTLTNIPIAIGEHEIEITKPGFETIRKTIQVTSKQSLFNFTMKQVELVGITLHTEPEGATVYFDGQDIGISPVSIFKFPGEYELRYELNSYLTVVDTLKITSDNTKFEKTVNLVKNLGYLNLDVYPFDVDIILDDKKIQSGLNELPTGTYVLKIGKLGYVNFEEQITVVLGETVEKRVELQKNVGFLNLIVTPDDAQITVRNTKIKNGLNEFSTGKYLLKVSKSGFFSHEEEVTIEFGKTQIKEINLIKNTSVLSWKSNPINASVTINKSMYVGRNQVELTPGTYLIEVNYPGYTPITETIVIERGKSMEKDWALTRETGSFRFLTSPIDAQIKMSQYGVEIQTWNGLKAEKSVPIGTYDVLVLKEGYRPKEVKLIIEKDKETEMKVNLEEAPSLELLNKKQGMSAAFKAMLIPGWGVRAVSGGQSSGDWITITTYSLIGSAFAVELYSQSKYSEYQKEVDLQKAESLYKTANTYHQFAYGLTLAGAAIWTYNVLWVAQKGGANTILKEQLKKEQELLTWMISPTPSGFALTVRF